MRTVTVVYHCESGNWWADSPDPGLESFTAGGRNLEETQRLAAEGLEFHLGEKVAMAELWPVTIDDGPFAVQEPATATRPLLVRLAMAPVQPILARGIAPSLAGGAR